MKGHLKDHWQLWITMAAILLGIGALLRTVAIDNGWSDFNANIAFIGAIVLLLVVYLTLQEVVNQFIEPRLNKFFGIKKEEKTPVVDDDFPPIEETPNQHQWEFDEISIDDVEFADEEIPEAASVPSPLVNSALKTDDDCMVINVSDIRERAKRAADDKHSALAKRVNAYVTFVMHPYVDNNAELERLIDLIAQFFEFPSIPTFSKEDTIKVKPDLKPIDLMHFGWNIGRAFHKKIEFTARFLKDVFPDVFDSMEVTTIEKKIKQDPLKGIIQINDNVKNFDLGKAESEAEEKLRRAKEQEEKIKEKTVVIPKEKPKAKVTPKLTPAQAAKQDMEEEGMICDEEEIKPYFYGESIVEEPD